MGAPSDIAIAAQAARGGLDKQVQWFALHWLGLELDDAQSASAAAVLAQGTHAPSATGETPSTRAGGIVEVDRRRIENVIQQNLRKTQVAVIGNAKAERAAEKSVLGEVERVSSLDQLLPTKPAPGATAGEVPLIAQIALRLTDLIKSEVDACFQKEFGPLARQLQAVIDAAQASGLLPKKDAAADADAADGDAENSEKTAAAPARNEAGNKPAKSAAPASQRD